MPDLSNDQALTLRWLDLSPTVAVARLLLPRSKEQEAQLRALARLGITPQEGETPLRAWLRAMCEENHLPVQYPCADVARAIDQSTNPGLHRFVFFLA